MTNKRINSCGKGKDGERELASVMRAFGFRQARRGQQYNGIDGHDVANAISGVHVECKRVEKLNIHEAVSQALRDAKEDEVPIVCHRKNRTAWLVTLPLLHVEAFAQRVLDELHYQRSLQLSTTESPNGS